MSYVFKFLFDLWIRDLIKIKLIMRIRLKNFRCYSDETFDFGEGGLALLSGPSGKGKSTILMGIHFALFGSGSKVTAYGKTSCMVELEFDGMKIVRTKKPNRVVVNDVYEDDSAQEIINSKFGDTFEVTGYISQNALNSFILMSPIDKLGFLEKFAFRDVNLGKIKGRCKAHISKCHDELLNCVSRLDMANNILKDMVRPTEIKFPLKYKKGQQEQTIKNENIRFQNCNILIRRSVQSKILASGEINDLNILAATVQSRKEMYIGLEEKLEDLGVEIDDQIYDGDSALDMYEKCLESYLEHRDLRIMEDQLSNDLLKLDEMLCEERSSLEKELVNIDSSLWKEYSKDDLKSTISDLKISLSDAEKVESLRKDIKRCNIDQDNHNSNKAELKQYIHDLDEKQHLRDKLITQKELYSCPSCHVKLRFVNEELFLGDNVNEEVQDIDIDSLKEEIATMRKNISKLQRIIPDEENRLERKVEAEAEIVEILASYEEIPNISGIKEDLDYLHSYQTVQNELDKKKKDIQKNINCEKFSSSYSTFKRNIERLQNKVTKLQEKRLQKDECKYELKEEELREKIIEQKQTRDKLKELIKRQDKIIEERDNYKRIIDETEKKHIKKYGILRDKNDLEEKVGKYLKNIDEQELKRNICSQNLKQIEEWNKYQTEIDNYQNWENKVTILEKKEKDARNEYAASTMLKDKILEAESIAMINIIDTINMHARVYLDAFFLDNPISVQLQPFKETKKSTKPNINIEIEYRGMECDIHMLSGGELSRIILAYTLAMAEMFNTPLILLDECTASLDQDLTSVVFDAIRENFNGKMALIIAHQVVTGTFDKIIRL